MAFELKILGKEFELLQKDYEIQGSVVYRYVKDEILHDPLKGEVFYVTFLDELGLQMSLFKDEDYFENLEVILMLDLYLGEDQRFMRTAKMRVNEIKDYLRGQFDVLHTFDASNINGTASHFNSMIHNDFVNIVKY